MIWFDLIVCGVYGECVYMGYVFGNEFFWGCWWMCLGFGGEMDVIVGGEELLYWCSGVVNWWLVSVIRCEIYCGCGCVVL